MCHKIGLQNCSHLGGLVDSHSVLFCIHTQQLFSGRAGVASFSILAWRVADEMPDMWIGKISLASGLYGIVIARR